MDLILIVEDDHAIANLIKTYVSMVGYGASIANDGESAIQMLQEESYSIVLLDLMLPEVSGEEVLEHVKRMGTPVIVISAKSALSERVKLLRAGADDYITKPFDSADLTARIEAVLRRYNKGLSILCVSDVAVDELRHKVKKGNVSVDLTPKEYDLLCFLLKNKNQAIKKEEIFRQVWVSDSFVESRTVDVHVQRLRKKLDLYGCIKTITKVGYMIEDEDV